MDKHASTRQGRWLPLLMSQAYGASTKATAGTPHLWMVGFQMPMRRSRRSSSGRCSASSPGSCPHMARYRASRWREANTLGGRRGRWEKVRPGKHICILLIASNKCEPAPLKVHGPWVIGWGCYPQPGCAAAGISRRGQWLLQKGRHNHSGSKMSLSQYWLHALHAALHTQRSSGRHEAGQQAHLISRWRGRAVVG